MPPHKRPLADRTFRTKRYGMTTTSKQALKGLLLMPGADLYAKCFLYTTVLMLVKLLHERQKASKGVATVNGWHHLASGVLSMTISILSCDTQQSSSRSNSVTIAMVVIQP